MNSPSAPRPFRLLAGSMWVLIAMLLNGLLSWLWTVALSRHFGPEGYGIYSTTVSVNDVIWIVLFGGAFYGLIKYYSGHLADDEGKGIAYVASGVKYLSSLGVLVSSTMLLLGLSLDGALRVMSISIAIASLTYGLRDGAKSVIASAQRMDYVSIIDLSNIILVLLSGSVLILAGYPSALMPTVIVLSAVGQLALSLYLLRRSSRSAFKDILRREKSFELFKEVYKFGLFVSLNLISFHLIKHSDVIIMKLFSTFTDVGIYSVADGYASIMLYTTSIALPLIQAVSEAYGRAEYRLLKDYTYLAIKYSLVIGICSAIVTSVMAEGLVLDFYGQAFAPAVQLLRMMVPGVLMVAIAYNLSAILVGLGKARVSGILFFGTLVIYLTLLLVLIPSYGATGAALAILISGFSVDLAIPYYLKKSLNVRPPRGNVKLALSAALTIAFLHLAPKFNVALVLLDALGGMCLFVLLLWVTGYISKKDLKMLRLAMSSLRSR